MNKIRNYFFFLLYILLRPNLWRLIGRVYLPVFVQYEWLKDYDIKTVIDIGAFKGHQTFSLSYLFPQAKIYAFEPIPFLYSKLKLKANNPKIVVSRIALSDKKERVPFYVTSYLPGSSLLNMESGYKKFLDYMSNSTTSKITVETTTLDGYFKEFKLNKDIFMKMDTQGSELKILQSGKNLLKRVSFVHIETSFDKIYEKQALFKDIYEFLTNAGFKYAGSIKDAEFYPLFKPALQQNSLFVKKQKLKRI